MKKFTCNYRKVLKFEIKTRFANYVDHCTGLQSARCWNERFDTFLKQINFKQPDAGLCVYLRMDDRGKIMIALYVDDDLILATDKELINDTLRIRNMFEITMGNSEYFLGMHVKQNRKENSIFINQ